jgi:WD40 repeat protein
MRPSPAFVAVTMLLASCGSPGPTSVQQGPVLAASLAAEWPTSAPPRQVEFSRDGRLLAASDASGLITLRETSSWRTIGQLKHEGGATSVAFSRDGKALFSAGYDGKVRKWDVATRKLAATFEGPTKTIWSMDVSPDGSRIAAAGEDAAIYVWTLANPAKPRILRGHERNIWEVRFSPDGKLLASGSFDKSARLWDAATGKPLRTLVGHDQAVVGLAFSPDGKLLATSGDDSTIRFWRLPAASLIKTIDVGNHTYKLAFTSDGRWLVSGGRAHGGLGTFWHQLTGGGGRATPIRIWRTADAVLVAALPLADDIAHVGIDPNGQWMATASEDRRVRLWRLKAPR